jgi:hypothetical protein
VVPTQTALRIRFKGDKPEATDLRRMPTWMADEKQVAYRVAPGGTLPEGFVVAAGRLLEDGTVTTDGPAVASFATKEEAEAEADRLNQLRRSDRD